MNRVYVGNLPYSVDRTQLAEIFAQAGEVTDSSVPLNDQHRSKGFGFVSFATQEQMENAIKMFDGKEVDGRVLRVNEARPMRDTQPGSDAAPAVKDEKLVKSDDTEAVSQSESPDEKEEEKADPVDTDEDKTDDEKSEAEEDKKEESSDNQDDDEE